MEHFWYNSSFSKKNEIIDKIKEFDPVKNSLAIGVSR